MACVNFVVMGMHYASKLGPDSPDPFYQPTGQGRPGGKGSRPALRRAGDSTSVMRNPAQRGLVNRLPMWQLGLVELAWLRRKPFAGMLQHDHTVQ